MEGNIRKKREGKGDLKKKYLYVLNVTVADCKKYGEPVLQKVMENAIDNFKRLKENQNG